MLKSRSFRIHSCMPEVPGAKPAASGSAGSAIRARIAILTNVLSKIEQGPREPQAQLIHKLRVATRRLTVTMTVLVSSLPKDGKRLRRGAKELRRAAGALRDADVHSQLLSRTLREAKHQDSLRDAPSRSSTAIADALALISEDRRQASQELRHVIAKMSSKKIQQLSKSFTKHLDDTSEALQVHSDTLRHKSLVRAFEVLRRVDVAAKGDLSHPPSLHKLRLSLKSLRYARESLAMVDPNFKADTTETARMQEQLGDINDISTLSDRLTTYVRMIDSQHCTEALASTRRLRNGLESLKTIFQSILERRCAAFAAWWLKTYPEGASSLFAPELAAIATDIPGATTSTVKVSTQHAQPSFDSERVPKSSKSTSLATFAPPATNSASTLLTEINIVVPKQTAPHMKESLSSMHNNKNDLPHTARNARRTITHATHHANDGALKTQLIADQDLSAHPASAQEQVNHSNSTAIADTITPNQQIFPAIFPYHQITTQVGHEGGQAGLWIAGHRIAVIDIGSNSIRLLVVEMIDDRTWTTLAEDRAMTRLAHGLFSDINLSEEAMNRSFDAIERFKAAALQHGVSSVRAFATAAVRTAANGPLFLQKIKSQLDIEVEIISGHLEGKYTYQSVARVVDLSKADACVADMGGGSLEVVSSKHGVITSVATMPLGAVRISEKFPDADISDASFLAMRQEISHTIGASVAPPSDHLKFSLVVAAHSPPSQRWQPQVVAMPPTEAAFMLLQRAPSHEMKSARLSSTSVDSAPKNAAACPAFPRTVAIS